MKALVTKIREEGQYLGNGILKVDSFVNHQLDPNLTMAMGREFAQRFAEAGVNNVTKIVTAEVSGIAPALSTAAALNVPIIYARKSRPITMPADAYTSAAPSHTKGGIVKLSISPEYLSDEDRVLLIDDFLATGKTISALVEVIRQSKATLAGIGCIIEKSFEGGRATLASIGVPIVTLAVIDRMDEEGIEVR